MREKLNKISDRQSAQLRTMVLLAGVATTLMIGTSLADPINLPKMVVLSTFCAWMLGSIAVSIFELRPFRLSIGQLALLAFAIGVLVAALLTDVKYTAFFGTTLRNDGALSYFSLAILTLAAMMSFKYANLRSLRLAILFAGAMLALYGLLQTYGLDPLKWTLLYNPVMGTLGNPDFFSALVGASAIATLWSIYSEKKRWVQGAEVLLLLVELFVIKRSGSFQGLVVFTFGLTALVLAFCWKTNRRYGIIVTGLASFGFFITLIGLFNKGPLAAHIYRASLRNRIDYWHAAVSMFKAHPLFGVGLERFGENYGRYAPQFQVVQGQPTNNAHNVFLQLLATGGLFVIIPYLFLLGVIFVATTKAIKGASGPKQMDFIALFTLWLAFVLISSISIDNLGVTVWFWIIGGALYGIAQESRFHPETRKTKQHTSGRESKKQPTKSLNPIAPVISLVAVFLTLLILVPAWRGSSSLLTVQRYGSGLTQTQFADLLKHTANIEPENTQTSILLGEIAMNFSQTDLALYFADRVVTKDPLAIYGQDLGARASDAEKKYTQAIRYRVRLLEIDRWNTANMLALVKDYVQVKDVVNARAIATRISTLYPNSADAKTAAALIKG